MLECERSSESKLGTLSNSDPSIVVRLLYERSLKGRDNLNQYTGIPVASYGVIICTPVLK